MSVLVFTVCNLSGRIVRETSVLFDYLKSGKIGSIENSFQFTVYVNEEGTLSLLSDFRSTKICF